MHPLCYILSYVTFEAILPCSQIDCTLYIWIGHIASDTDMYDLQLNVYCLNDVMWCMLVWQLWLRMTSYWLGIAVKIVKFYYLDEKCWMCQMMHKNETVVALCIHMSVLIKFCFVLTVHLLTVQIPPSCNGHIYLKHAITTKVIFVSNVLDKFLYCSFTFPWNVHENSQVLVRTCYWSRANREWKSKDQSTQLIQLHFENGS